jgi:hypothetical protein
MRSPWRRASPGILVGLGLLVLGVGLGLALAPGYLALAVFGLVFGAGVLLVALFRAMRPALRRPTSGSIDEQEPMSLVNVFVRHKHGGRVRGSSQPCLT